MPENMCRFLKVTKNKAIALDVIASYLYIKDAEVVELLDSEGRPTYISGRNLPHYPNGRLIKKSVLAIYSKVVLGGDQRAPEKYEIYGDDADKAADALMKETYST